MNDPRSFLHRRILLGATAIAAAGGALVYLWSGWCMFPLSNWNEMRLAPAFALRHGTTMYPPLGGGPLSTWIYGPIGAVINLPATYASSATAALQTAGAINLLTLVAPVAVICAAARELRAHRWTARLLATAVVALLLPATSLMFQVADHAATGLGLLSCWYLVRSGYSPRPFAVVAAILCVLSIWAKQTSVFLPVGQALFLWWQRDWHAAARYLGWVVGVGILTLAVAAAVFDPASLWLNLVEIPRRLPWATISEKLALRWPALLGYLVVPLPLLWLIRTRGYWPPRESELGQFLRCCIVVFATLLPISLFSFFKIGGDTNVLHSPFYLIPAAVTATLAHALSRPMSTVAVVAVVVAALALRSPQLSAPPARPLTAHIDHAALLARQQPRATWFPLNPLVTFYTDKRLYHVEDGIATRHLAGFGLREPDLRRHLPDPLSTIVYPATYEDPFALQLLPEFTERAVQGLWTVYRRPQTR